MKHKKIKTRPWTLTTQKRLISVVKWVCLLFIVTAKVDYFLVIWHLASACVMSLSFPSLSNFICPFSFLSLQDGVGILSPFQEWLWTVDHRITQAAEAQLDAASSWGCHSSPSLWSTASCLCQDQEGDELPVTAESGNTPPTLGVPSQLIQTHLFML